MKYLFTKSKVDSLLTAPKVGASPKNLCSTAFLTNPPTFWAVAGGSGYDTSSCTLLMWVKEVGWVVADADGSINPPTPTSPSTSRLMLLYEVRSTFSQSFCLFFFFGFVFSPDNPAATKIKKNGEKYAAHSLSQPARAKWSGRCSNDYMPFSGVRPAGRVLAYLSLQHGS